MVIQKRPLYKSNEKKIKNCYDNKFSVTYKKNSNYFYNTAVLTKTGTLSINHCYMYTMTFSLNQRFKMQGLVGLIVY